MKGSKAKPGSGTISSHEMRFQFTRVLDAMRAGRSLALTYRIVPAAPDAAPSEDDPIFRLHESAEPIGPMTKEDIDRAVHGDQGYSFVDCLGFCLMKERGNHQALNTDEHFEKAGFAPLLSRP